MKQVFSAHIDQVVSDIGISNFRTDLYFTERMDNLIKAHMPLLQEVYRMYSNHYRRPGETFDYMVAHEF